MDRHKDHNKPHNNIKEKSKEGFDLPDVDLEKKIEEEKISEERRRFERRKQSRREEDRVVAEEMKKTAEENEKLKGEIASLKDSMLRRQADFENYKKRVLKQHGESRIMAIRDLAHDIILINDDLLRAIEASESIGKDGASGESNKSFLDGVMMISKRIEETLKKYNVVEINSLNQEFDPNFHEAVEIENDGDVESDTVTKVYHKGFRIDDLVVRSAKVKVSKPKKEQPSASVSEKAAQDNGTEKSE